MKSISIVFRTAGGKFDERKTAVTSFLIPDPYVCKTTGEKALYTLQYCIFFFHAGEKENISKSQMEPSLGLQ